MAIESCRPGVSLGQLHQLVVNHFTKFSMQSLFLHSLGHGLGLNIHEPPFFNEPQRLLEPGMVITIEPGLYEPSICGVRIEDTILITKSHPKILT